MKQVALAVQIVNYKTKDFLAPLLESILQDINSALQVEINILDNASGDNLEDIGEAYKTRNVHVYAAERNGGYGAGHNLLAAKTRAQYLLLLNPDMVMFEPRTIERLIETAREHNAAVAGPRLLTPADRDRRDLHNVGLEALKQQRWDHGKKSFLRYTPTNKVSEVAWVSGAAFLIGRQAFEEIGGFDEKFFLYFEEVDLCDRLRRQSKTIIYNPGIQMIHYNGAEATKLSVYGAKSLVHYGIKRMWRK